MRHIVIYEIRLVYLIKLFFKRKQKLSIIFINNGSQTNFQETVKIFLLNSLSFAKVLKQPVFFRHFQNIDTSGDVSLQFQVYEDASNESMDWAYLQLEELKLLSVLPDYYTRNLALIIAREVHDQFLTFFRQIALFQNAFDIEKYELHVWQDASLFQLSKRRADPGVILSRKLPSGNKIFLDYLISLSGFMSILINLAPIYSVKMQGTVIPLLCTHREEFHSDTSFRNKLAWFFSLSDKSSKILCFRNRKYQRKFPKRKSDEMPNVIDGRRKFLGFSRFEISRHLIRPLIAVQIRNLGLLKHGRATCGALSVWRTTVLFLWAIESNSHTIRKLQSMVYVYEDIYWEVHVFNTLAEIGLIKTMKIQYSNLPRAHVLMHSNPSILMAFSEKMVGPFKSEIYGVGPKKVISVGYYSPIAHTELVNRAKNLKTSLNDKGASFIIGFFPESVQRNDDIWALFSDSDFLKDVHTLSNLVLSNPEIGIILKTQFMRRNPLLLFPKDSILRAAFQTGRFLIPEFGIHRNLVTPTEIALASNICIGDLIGATASLEVALAGTRSVMIDSTNFGPKFRSLYFNCNQIVFQDIRSALAAIMRFKNNQNELNPIGVWDQILNELEIRIVDTQKIIEKQIKQVYD